MGFDDEDPAAVKSRPRGPEKADAAAEYRVRARFYAIRQVDGEPAYDWYRRVRAAAVPCRFGGPDRQTAVADKFVTGLRPGPVADRLLGERADRPPEDLLAVAVAAEELARGPRRGAAGADRATSAARTPTDAPVPPAGAGDRKDALIDEIREGLKLYRYSGEGYARPRRGGSGYVCGGGGEEDDDEEDGDDPTRRRAPPPIDRTNNGYNQKSPLKINENVFNSNMKSMHNEKSWWKNKFERTSKEYANKIISKNVEKYDDKNYYENNSNQSNSKCYCCSLIYK